MTLKEFIENLKKFVKENPETLEMQVITSIDNEENGFNPVCFLPCKGVFEGRNFLNSDDYASFKRNENETNAVCVN